MNYLNTDNRYPALSAIVVVIKIVAVLVAVIGVIGGVGAIRGGYDIVPGVAVIVGTVVGFVILWAAAESISVIIDIEANTRAGARAATLAREEHNKEQLSSTSNLGLLDRDPQGFLERLGYFVERNGKTFMVSGKGESPFHARSYGELVEWAKAVAARQGVRVT